MAKTNPLYTVEDTFSGVNISAGASVYQFVAAADGKVQIIPKITNGAGNDDYVAWLTRQWEGAGAVSEVLGRTTHAVASGVTVFEFVTLQMQVKSGDVIEVMIDGPAGDTSVNGNIRIVADNPSVLEQADILSDATPFAGALIAAIPTNVWGFATRTLSSFGTLVADIWANATRTLTTFANVLSNILSGSKIRAYRGDTFSLPITGLGSLANMSQLYFTVKASKGDTDLQALIKIAKTGGLQRINGSLATAGNGSIVIDDESAGNITITVNAAEMALLSGQNGGNYDIQIVRSSGTPVSTLSSGEFILTDDITQATT